MLEVSERIKRVRRLRFAALYPFGIYLVIFAVLDQRLMPWGVLIMVAGIGMRLWSNGYAIKMDKLTTSGPYALVRNPLYLGTGLIILGIVVMFKLFWAGMAVLLFIGAAYARTIRKEEKMLADKFGTAYLDYCAKVPAMWPTVRPYDGGDKWPFSLKRLWDSREHKVALWLAVLVIGFLIKKEFLVGGFRWDVRIAVLVLAAGALALLDLVGECVCWRQRAAGRSHERVPHE